jgi:hypothetical protein
MSDSIKNDPRFGDKHLSNPEFAELSSLCEGLCENTLSLEQASRLESLLMVDAKARDYYRTYIDLHGSLHWGVTATEQPSGDRDRIGESHDIPIPLALESASSESRMRSLRAGVQPSSPSTLQQAPRRLWQSWLSTPRFSMAASIGVLLLAFTVVVAGERILRVVFHHSISAYPTGGSLRSAGNELLHGGSFRGTRRVGSSYFSDIGLANLLVFRLPALKDREQVKSARLEWTFKERTGDPQFSVDLYGLGYVSSAASLTGAFWEGSQDTGLQSEYGMLGSKQRRVSLITKGVMTPVSKEGRIAVESAPLSIFLQSLYDDGAQGGELVVFRLNADSPTAQIARTTGYEVVHPPEIKGKTVPAQFPSLHIVADQVGSMNHAAAESVITSHGIEANRFASVVRSDGVNSVLRGGTDQRGTRRVGSSSTAANALVNLLVFRLPTMREGEHIRSARLEWTLKGRSGEPAFAVDLYGLGFVTSQSPALLQTFWEGPEDRHLRVEYGMEGTSDSPVALVARHAMSPNSPLGRIVIEGPELVEFLRSLYDSGAVGGEFAVFRLNANMSTFEVDRSTGYEIVHPPERLEKASPAELPTLHLISY